VRQNRRHAGAHWSLANHQRPIPGNQRHVADLYAGDIGDGVERTGLQTADRDPQFAQPVPLFHGFGTPGKTQKRPGRGSTQTQAEKSSAIDLRAPRQYVLPIHR